MYYHKIALYTPRGYVSKRCTGIAEVMGSNPVQAWIFSGLIFITAVNSVVNISAKIAFIFTSLSAVHIYDFHIFTVIIWIINWPDYVNYHCTEFLKLTFPCQRPEVRHRSLLRSMTVVFESIHKKTLIEAELFLKVLHHVFWTSAD